MAPRVFLLCILFTVGLLTGRSIGQQEPNLTLHFDQEPQNVVAVRGKPLVLQCAASSSIPGPVNISWTLEDEPLVLVNDSRRYILGNGSLYFKKVLLKRSGSSHEGFSDQGAYRCVVRNSVGALVSRSAQLRIATLSHNFSMSPCNVTAEEDDIARFMCQIESVPKALISWQRNGKPLPQNSRYFTLDSGVLYITKVQPSDAGTYRCVAENLLATKKPRLSSEGHLEISPKSPIPRTPVFVSVFSSMIEVKAGENIILDCAATGSPIPELTWTFLPRIPGSKQHPVSNVTRTGVNILTLLNVTANHNGTYTCTASSPGLDKQTTPVTQNISVEVLEPPIFVEAPKSQVYHMARTVRFDCVLKDNTTEVKWLKDGKELQINGRIKKKQSGLVLSNTVTDDSGLYQCMSWNKAGESWVAARLLNMSQPQPEPQGLVCRTLSDSQVKLEWKEPAKFADNISAYTIHYLPSNGGDEQREVSLNCSYLVQKLLPFTNYTFYVRAYNSKSASDFSKSARCQTGEAVPLAAPQISLKALSPTSLRVTWVPLSKQKAQGVITEYKIQWRRKNQPSSPVVHVKGDMTDYTITGLNPGERYEVRVLAATSKGWPNQPDEFPWIDEEMPNYGQQNVPQAPTVHLTVVNSTSIEVTWSVPPENKYKPNGFKLYYRKMNNEKKFGPINLAANTTQFLVGDLDPDSSYEVLVHGYNNEGAGESGLKTIHTLPINGNADLTAVPSMGLEPPTNLEAEPTSPTSINLTWAPPQSAINVSYYTVCYGQVQSTFAVNSSIYSYVSSTSQGVEVNCLKPYTLYEFKVRTHDHNNQHGPYSQKVECHTLEDVPSAVLNVQWRVLNSSTIHLMWREPQYTNGVIKYYEIMLGSSVDNLRTINVSNSKISTEITNLVPNKRYFISIRAVTRAGMGPPSDRVTITIPVVTGLFPSEQPPSPHDMKTDQHLGIVVGVAIGVGCIILCAVVIVWRRRCMKMASPECSGMGGGTSCASGGHHANGNGYYREWDRSAASQTHIVATAGPTEIHELDYFTSGVTTTNIPSDMHADHLDTKGGYPNGQLNGLKHPLLTNGRIPNGQVLRDRNSVRIIENPQFNRRDSGGPQQKVLIPASKSHSSHPHNDQKSEIDGEEEGQLLVDHKTPLLLSFGGEEQPFQQEVCHGSVVDPNASSRDRLGDTTTDDIGISEHDLNTTQVTNLDLSFDGSILSGGNENSHHQQQQNSQQHSPQHQDHHQQQQHHHQHYRRHQEPYNISHTHQSNSSHDSQGCIGLHHIDNITGTTTTGSQFHPPLLNQPPLDNDTKVKPQNELLHSAAAGSIPPPPPPPQKNLLLNQ